MPWPLQGHGWIALLGVLSFLFIFLRLFFILCFLVDFLGHEFFSVYFFYGFLIIAWSMKNCFGFEKLLWVRYLITSNALSHFLYRSNYKWYIIQLNVILIIVLKKSRCFPFFLEIVLYDGLEEMWFLWVIIFEVWLLSFI